MRTNLTHLPRIPAPSATINTFTLFVLLSREMRPLRSSTGLADQRRCFSNRGSHPNAHLSVSIHLKEKEIRLKKSRTDSHFLVMGTRQNVSTL